MKYRKITPYKIGLTALIGLPLLLTACKEKQDPEPEPTQDVEVEFDIGNFAEKLDIENVQQLLQDKTIRYIYLTPTDHWTGWTASQIPLLRKAGLQPCLELSPKVHGRGNFDFKLGEASKVPTDSLWYVKNGWTINKGR